MYPGDRAAGALFDPTSVPDPAQLAAVYGQFAARVQLTDDDYLAQLLRNEWVVFEGAQGVLLDEWRGFHPYTTWSTTTYANIETALRESGASADPLRIGLLRAYTTRHGAGPFPSEDALLTRDFPDQHNGTHRWQGIFRAGHLDLLLHRYALEVCERTDVLALSHLDRAAQMGSRLQTTNEYVLNGRSLDRLAPGPFTDLDYQSSLTQILQAATPVYESAGEDIPALVERTLKLPVAITSSGTGTQHKSWRI
jgi:adenylosuccinate synthase